MVWHALRVTRQESNLLLLFGACSGCEAALCRCSPLCNVCMCLAGLQHERKDGDNSEQWAGLRSQRGGNSGGLRGFGRRPSQKRGSSYREMDYLRPLRGVIGTCPEAEFVHSGTVPFYKSVLEKAFSFLYPRTVCFTLFIFICLIQKSEGTCYGFQEYKCLFILKKI